MRKKNVFSIGGGALIIMLALSVVMFTGCDEDQPALFPPDFPQELVTTLQAMGVTSFAGPDGVTFSGWEKTTNDIHIVWDGGDETKFAAYGTKLGGSASASVRAVVVDAEPYYDVTIPGLKDAYIGYFKSAGTIDGTNLSVKVGSFSFFGTKK